MGTRTTPTLEMFRRYRELGGEIVTVGSDAHAPEWGRLASDEAGRSSGLRGLSTMRYSESAAPNSFRSDAPTIGAERQDAKIIIKAHIILYKEPLRHNIFYT